MTTQNFYSTKAADSIWIDYNYKVENQILTNKHIEDSLDELWSKIGYLVDDDHYLQIILKVKFNDSSIRSITYLKPLKV
jgi:hypothetical protein